MNKKLINSVLTGCIISVLSIAAFATVTTAGGGRWDYGVNHRAGGVCWSRYLHDDLRHGSTAMNGDGDYEQDDGVDEGEESDASVDSTPHGNKAYWHRCGIDKRCGYTQD